MTQPGLLVLLNESVLSGIIVRVVELVLTLVVTVLTRARGMLQVPIRLAGADSAGLARSAGAPGRGELV